LPQVRSTFSSSGFFTENKGQWDSSILFVGDTSFGKVAFAKDAIYYQMSKSLEVSPTDEDDRFLMDFTRNRAEKAPRAYETQVVKLSFVNPLTPKVEGIGLLSHYNNYFIGNDSSKWTSYCHNYSKIEYRDIWEGIDLAYFFTPEGLKYEYYVAPKATIQDLQIRAEGAELATHGNSLEISTDLGIIQDSNLQVFDKTTQQEINSNFQIQNNILSFQGIPEERENTIVIDPLVWSTYLGGSWSDNYFSSSTFDIDSEGNAYIFGQTDSSFFPVTPVVIQKSIKGEWDVFVTKLDSTGSSLIYSTYLGGSDSEFFDLLVSTGGIKVDSFGNVFIAGTTNSEDFPITQEAFQSINNGNHDAFVVKINTTGSELIYSSYLGGSNFDAALDIAIDESGNTFICGHTYSPDFPITKTAFQKTNKADQEIFITKINSTGNGIIYSTFLGSSGKDFAYAITVDTLENAYICGFTTGSDYPITKNAYQKTFNGEEDVFITKINPSGSDLLFSTYLGGSGVDLASGIFVDKDLITYVCGGTKSTDFPVTREAYQKKHIGDLDAFIIELNASGSELLTSTYLGGSGEDIAQDIDVDENGDIYIVGETNSTNFPITPGSMQSKRKGTKYNIFISKTNSLNSELLYSTYLGGTGKDMPNFDKIIRDNKGYVYICGETLCNDFPITKDAYQKTFIGEKDTYIAKLDLNKENTPPDSTPPILEIISPEDNSTTIDDQIMIKAKIYDDESGIDSITMNKGEKPKIEVYDTSLKTFTWLYPIKIGVNKLKINITNKAGLITSTNLTVTRVVDKTGPTIMMYNPLPYASVTESQLIVKGKAVDKESGLQEVLVNKKRVPFNENGEFETTVILEEFENTVTIEARDKQDNNSILSISVKCELCFKKNYLIIELWVGKNKAFIDGLEIPIDVPPMVRFSRTQVPLRFIVEGFKATVNYDAKTQKIVVQHKTTHITLQIDNPEIVIEDTLDGVETVQKYNLELPPYIYKGRTMVPVRVISEAFGAKVDYGSSEQKITISMKR
jgi:hypothetical protein